MKMTSEFWHDFAGGWDGIGRSDRIGLTSSSPPFPGTNVNTLQRRFGSMIRRRHEKIDLRRESLADKAGLHHTRASLLDRRKRMPSLLVIEKLAAALDTAMASLMKELEAE